MSGMCGWKNGERYDVLDAAGSHEERIETNGDRRGRVDDLRLLPYNLAGHTDAE